MQKVQTIDICSNSENHPLLKIPALLVLLLEMFYLVWMGLEIKTRQHSFWTLLLLTIPLIPVGAYLLAGFYVAAKEGVRSGKLKVFKSIYALQFTIYTGSNWLFLHPFIVGFGWTAKHIMAESGKDAYGEYTVLRCLYVVKVKVYAKRTEIERAIAQLQTS
jgi:hypothetical protein